MDIGFLESGRRIICAASLRGRKGLFQKPHHSSGPERDKNARINFVAGKTPKAARLGGHQIKLK